MTKKLAPVPPPRPQSGTGDYLVVENTGKGYRKVMSVHWSFNAALNKLKKLRKTASDPKQFTLHHEIAYSVYPGPEIEVQP